MVFAGFSPSPGLNMAAIQSGWFHMGSASIGGVSAPPHAVSISRPFWIGKYEVTQSEYLSIMGVNPSYMQGWNWPNWQSRPVEQVTWFDVMAYCSAVNSIQMSLGRVPSGYQYRLPTEAEWEYCCRAGTNTEWNTGSSLVVTQANFSLNQTAVVGSYAPNPWGLFDTHGNIREWCLDSWDGNANYPSSAVVDPYVTNGIVRVARGGGWGNSADYCRSASRDYFMPNATTGVGFRVVLAPILVP